MEKIYIYLHGDTNITILPFICIIFVNIFAPIGGDCSFHLLKFKRFPTWHWQCTVYGCSCCQNSSTLL